MNFKHLVSLVSSSVVLLGTSSHTTAATAAFDHANNYTSWSTGSTGGFGFSTWTIRTDGGGAAGSFLATQGAPNFNTDLNGIDTGGKAWGTYANGGGFQSVAAFRSLTGGSLLVGQAFDFSFENGNIQTGGTMGLTLRNGNASATASDYNNGARFELLFTGGSANYTIVDGGGTFDTGIAFTDDGFDVTFLLTGTNTYDLSIYNHDTLTTTTFAGRTLGGSGGLDSFAFFNRDVESSVVSRK